MIPEDRALRDDILLAMLPNVPFDGWSRRSLRDGLKAAGIGPVAADEQFPLGVVDIVDHFAEWADRRMLEEMARSGAEAMGGRDRLTLAIKLRLQVLTPHREATRRALSLMGLPQNAPRAMRVTYRTANAIWHAAGDASADLGFYSKRAMLIPLYGAVVMYWLADESDDFAGTWSFLERRLDGLLSLPALGRKLRDRFDRLWTREHIGSQP